MAELTESTLSRWMSRPVDTPGLSGDGVRLGGEATGRRALYFEEHVARGVREMAADFTLVGGRRLRDRGAAVLVAWRSPIVGHWEPGGTIPATGCHVSLTGTHWVAQTWGEGMTDLRTVGRGLVRLRRDGTTVHRLSVEVDEGRLTITTPRGSSVVKHPSIGSGEWACGELFQQDAARDAKPRLLRFLYR